MYDCPATFYMAVAAVTTTGIQFCLFALFRFLFFPFSLSLSLSSFFLSFFLSFIFPYVQTRKRANAYVHTLAKVRKIPTTVASAYPNGGSKPGKEREMEATKRIINERGQKTPLSILLSRYCELCPTLDPAHQLRLRVVARCDVQLQPLLQRNNTFRSGSSRRPGEFAGSSGL